MSYPLSTSLPFGAGSSLCPPDVEPPCTCAGDRVDPACPVDGDCGDDFPASDFAGVGRAGPRPGPGNPTPPVPAVLGEARQLIGEAADAHAHSPHFALFALRRAGRALADAEALIREQLT